jgi:hypothetical protein
MPSSLLFRTIKFRRISDSDLPASIWALEHYEATKTRREFAMRSSASRRSSLDHYCPVCGEHTLNARDLTVPGFIDQIVESVDGSRFI